VFILFEIGVQLRCVLYTFLVSHGAQNTDVMSGNIFYLTDYNCLFVFYL